jgi:zinc-binding in reverse transcriptase
MTNIPLKIKIFIWLVKRNKILTKSNLAKKGWTCSVKCVFCDAKEDANHLFVGCPMVNNIWNWIASYNNFIFTGTTLDDLWLMNCCIPLKDKLVVEVIRCVVLWVIWLERNKLCFTNKAAKYACMLDSQIIGLTRYWCDNKGKVDLLKLSLVLPQDVAQLSLQVRVVPVEAEAVHFEGDQTCILEEVPILLMGSSNQAMKAPHMFGNEVDDILL